MKTAAVVRFSAHHCCRFQFQFCWWYNSLMLSHEEIAANYRAVWERVGAAALGAGRAVDAVRLVVVTKGQPLQAAWAAILAGASCLGENYVEEAVPKILALSNENPVEWHMIGHVQSRKAEPVSRHFAVVHSLDNLKLARRLDRFAGEAGRSLPVLLECNVSGEASKFGWEAWEEADWSRLAEQLAPVLDLPNLDVRGLMTIAPFSPQPETARPCFQRLRRLQTFLRGQFPQLPWAELSMGMSADFEVAVQEGATIVRIGTAILGERPV
jgi:pyridoxal phosphate enzyme (YggS family)